jgi:hypothetical protein
LGQHRAGGVVHRSEQMDLAAVYCAAGAAQRLAVDRDRPSPPIMAVGMRVAVGKPGADHSGQGLGVEPGESAADRGLGGDHHPAVLAGGRAPARLRTRAQPDRGLWSSLKAVELANLTGPTLAEVIDQAHKGVERVRQTPHLAYSFLRHAGLSVS